MLLGRPWTGLPSRVATRQNSGVTRLDTCSTSERKIIDFRKLGLRGARVLGRYHYTYAHPGLPVHRHEHMLEICYLAKGEQTYRVGNREYQLRGGDVFATFPGESHGTGRSPEEKGDLYWLILDTQPDWRDFPGCEPADGPRLRESLLALHPRQFRGTPVLKSELDDIFVAYANEDFAFRNTSIANSLVRFLLKVVECGQQARVGPRLSREMALIRTHIEASLTRKDRLDLDHLARLAGMSLSRFKARFRLETGIPPAEFITRRKIEHAARMLAEGCTATHAAFELGFSSSQHFSTVFRRFKGECPGEFWESKNSKR